jgi:hypothetical protein
LKGTCWEQRKNGRNPPPHTPHPKLQRKINQGTLTDFYFQNCSSPFLAWANGKGRILGQCMEENSMTELEESQVVNLTICYHVV